MKCPKCNGSGWDNENMIKCTNCNNGVVEQTNEDWFCSLTTAEKAKWLSRHSQFMYECGENQTTPKIMYEEDWEWWLKEKHHDN